MIIFEILFKNPSILQPNPLFELEAGDGAQERLGRGVFRSAIQVRVNHSVEDFNVKGIVHKKILIFWDMMECGTAHFGRRGFSDAVSPSL